MKALTCEMCGSTNLIKQDGVFVCQQCGTKYSLEEARKMMIEGTVSVHGTVSVDNSSLLQNLYVLGRRALTNESIEALDYYKRILEMDPYSKEAIVVTQLVGIDNSRKLSYVGGGEDCVNSMSEEEKSYYLNLLKPIFVSKGCYALFIDIQSGLVDAYHSLWGNCFVEAWCESAKGALEDLYNAYTRSLDSEPFDDNHLSTALMFYPGIVAAIQKINPTQDLIEENNRIALMRSKKEELDREAERTERERIAAKERAERERIAKDRRGASFMLLYCILAFFFVGGIAGLAKSWPYDEDILWGNIFCAISIFLSFIIYVIYKINQFPAKWHLLVLFILIGITAYFNYIDREILYTIECPKCGHLVEKEARFKHIVDDEEYPTYCGRCDNDFMTLFNSSFFSYPRPIGTYYNDVCRKNNENHERARRESLKEDEPQLTDNERKEQSSDVINSENQVECGAAFTSVPSSKHFYGGIDITGSKVIPFIYEWPFYFSEGLASVRKNGKSGYIDRSGQEIVPCIYIYANPFSEGLASVQNANYEYGYIDKSGNSVIPFQYREAEPFSEGLAFVRKKDGDYSFIDKTGKEVLTSIYINDNSINFEILKDGYTDYGELLFFSEGLVCKRDFETNLNGYLDKKGREVIPCIYEYASKFSNGLALVRNSEWKYGYINKDGKLVISYQYDVAKSFSEGLAAVEISGKYGYIDKTGKTVIPFFYDYADSFVNGIAAVRKDNKIGFIDKEGTVIIPFLYNDYEIFSNGLIRVQNSEFKYGFIDKTGKEVIPFIYVYEEEIE